MTSRRLPRWSELKPLLRWEPIEFDATQRRLRRALTIDELRALARRRTPRGPFDYTDGGAEQEVSQGRAREVFDRLEFHPNVLRQVSEVDPSRKILGRASTYPFGFAPTGFTRMMQHEGERAVARVAEKAGIPYALSTVGTTSIEEVASAAPDGDRWFQLYVWHDRAAAKELVDRARAAGYSTLALTVDTPVAGARHRDKRNGLTMPPSLTPRTAFDMALHPSWWFNVLTTEPLEFATFRNWPGEFAELLNQVFDPSLTWDDVDWLRSIWDGSLVVKGIQSLADARLAIEHGADAVWLSNHGGRQLDRAPVPLRLVPQVRELAGDRAEVFVDTGFMSGADIVAGIALGADAVFVGKAFLYGLMAGGERGVGRTFEILSTELLRTMRLLGVRSLDELSPAHITLPAGP